MLELGTLGKQLMLAVQFQKSGFNLEQVFSDIVTAEKDVSAKELFTQKGKRFFLRSDSIPGDLAIKAIAFDNKSLFLELAPIDIETVKKVIADNMFLVILDQNAKWVSDANTHKTLVSIGPIQHHCYGDIKLAPRCL